MANHFFNKRNVDFLLYEVHDAESLTKHTRFADHTKETFDMTIDAATQIADNLMFPFVKDVDKNQPELKDGQVTVHPAIKDYLKALGESGIIGADFDYEDGGAQMPVTITSILGYILMAANNGMMFTGLTAGAARLIASFGSQELKDTYIPNMISGKWQGTMCLTEPQAGSSLSDITSTAEPLEDGTYKIRGQKVFISAGDHDAADNIIHLFLGRIKGAPLGTKGISLFVIPKFRLDGTDNDVTSMGIYHKLGQKGVPAMHLGFGDKNDDCIGYLVGEPNKGLNYMFQMMNEARIGVGITGASIASAAYYASLEYAKERPQSRRLNQKHALDAPQIPIIQHPDVKRMLLFQKAVVEGSLSLLLETSKFFDLSEASDDPEEKENAHLMLELLTPIAKTFPCEYGMKATSDAVQCFGGYGFTEDFPVEQYYRDIRITPIYEGTTGIQSQDLLGRKVPMAGGKATMLLTKEVGKTVMAALQFDELKRYALLLKDEGERLQKVTMHLLSIAGTGDVERFLSDATLYMEMFSLNVVAWQWLKQAVVAKQKLITSNDDTEFYESKIHTMKYFFHYEIPKTQGLATRLMDEEVLTIMTEKEIVM
ncbi:acyl-CoA dehydrogenase domain-containing protein [Emticicia oligotrophica DSM 17448]|uniref:Acyl-CoA dehydrogenase domain-containing protein n=1 Tax=Emticicia oligotrophica (strain DSM 17448 / CIP 109782 / MTCC 6937 / GPTSA100-15) TaxID=929562 RepID=A0ABN4APD6_EMTOG|nr:MULTISPECIES: acyl-CoA dehydrogenase [Emticicia]AFK02989.1 acyl-CoA dehydrogenase domain-containing protein [Emticicia oligotrophica DSM 17448]